ncbi:MAG TPA: hydrogenase maturation protease [Armatimonadota bacterium]|jgi:hydrogenase maturation protease
MEQDQHTPHILIAGLGNLLLQDDGVGIHAVRLLEQDAPPGVCVADIGAAVLDALHLFEWADMILAIDAMKTGGAPGTIYRFSIGDVDPGGVPTSLHELSLIAALRFLPYIHTPHISILGVEPDTIDYGLELTPAVQNALPHLVHAARDIVAGWQRYPVSQPV